MITIYQITQKEHQLLKTIAATFPYSSWEELSGDPFTWFEYKDVKAIFSKPEFAGLVSSLTEKGIVMNQGDGEDYRAELCLTEGFVEHMASIEPKTISLAPLLEKGSSDGVKTVFSLVYMLQPIHAKPEDGLIGPKLFSAQADAVYDLLSYTASRIFDSCLDCFIDSELGGEINIPDDGSITREGLMEFLAALPLEKQSAVNAWYFDFEKEDGEMLSFYKIEELVFPE